MSSKGLKDYYQSFLVEVLGVGPKHLVGIDIGVNSIKVCEVLKSKKSYKLKGFVRIPLAEGVFADDEIQSRDQVIKAIAEGLSQLKAKTPNACLGLWGPNSISKRIQVPVGTEEEIEDQVLWEAEQYIPFDVDASSISFDLIGENVGGGVDVMIASATHSLIEDFKNMATEAGANVKVVDLNQFALANLFSHTHSILLEDSPGAVILLEFGAYTSNVLIFKNGALVFTRELAIGGNNVTDEIQRSMALSFDEAEDLKTQGDENGNLPEEILDVVAGALSSFMNELKKTINFYLTASGEDFIQKCFLTGGSSLLPGLLESIESEFEMETIYFNPFETIQFDNKFSEEELQEIATIGGVAMGLGMRSLEDDQD